MAAGARPLLAAALLSLCGLLPRTAHSSPAAVRVATGDGTLAVELSSTAAITGLELGGEGVAPPRPQRHAGGFALSEYLGGSPCESGGPTPPGTSNRSLLENGDFAQRAADGGAAGWAASSVAGYQCTGYRRVTGANVTRPGHAAAIEASTTKPHELAGAERVVFFTPATSAMFQTLVLSGWSRAERDSNGTQAIDYSVYADVEYSDGTYSFGEAAPFRAGAHGWQFASHEFAVLKPVKQLALYAMYRNRIGRVWFSDLALTGVPHAACIPPPKGSVYAAKSPTGNHSVAKLSATFAPPTWGANAEAGVTATFEGLSDHIRITGAVALTRHRPCPYPNPCPPTAAPPDRAVSLRLAFPLAGAGWQMWTDPETAVDLPSDTNSNTSQQTVFGGQSEPVAGLPHTIDRYPLLAFTSPDRTRGLVLAVPMVAQVQLFRIAYDARQQLLHISFEFGLTSQAQRFPSMATFACLLMPLAQPEWGFRSALSSYYTVYDPPSLHSLVCGGL